MKNKGNQNANMHAAHIAEREEIQRTRKRTDDFYAQRGRRPRILVGRIHRQGSDREMKTIAAALADVGFDVDIHTSVQAPHHVVRMALDNDVHAVGLSGAFSRDEKFVLQLINMLHKEGRSDIVVAFWDIFVSNLNKRPENDKSGKLVVFETGTPVAMMVGRILEKLV